MRRTAALSALVGANLLALLLFQWYVITRLGPGLETDALFAASAVPLFVLNVVGGSLMRVIVPFLASVDESIRARQAGGILLLTTGAFCFLAVVGFLTVPFWFKFVFSGFSAETLELAIQLEQILLVALVFMGAATVLAAIHRSYRRFLRVEAVSLLVELFALGAVVWAFPRYGVVTIAWLMVARFVLQVVLLVPGIPLRPLSFRFDDPAMRQVLGLSGPLMLASSYYKGAPIVDRVLMSHAPAGSLSLYHLGQQLYTGLSQVVGRSYVQPIVPTLAEHFSQGARESFRSLYRNRLLSLAALLSAGLILLLLAGRPAIDLFLRHGAFMSEHADELWWILIALYGSLVGNVLGQVSTSAFYARGDTRTPTRVGIPIFTLGLAFKVAGFYWLGVMGLAWGTSLFMLTSLAILILALERSELMTDASAVTSEPTGDP